MWGAGFRDGTRTRINVNIGTQSVSRALLSERDSCNTCIEGTFWIRGSLVIYSTS